MSDSRRIVPLLLVLIVAWLGRLHALGSDSLWGDEILSFHRASQPSLERTWQTWGTANHPPMYELGILRPWLKLGHNEFLLRFPSVFFGTLTVAAVYVLGRAVLDARTGALSSLLLAISPQHICYSREARMYALLPCLITLEIYCLHRAVRSSRSPSKYWVAYTVFTVLSLYTHYYAGFTLWALTGFMLIRLAVDWDFALFKRWSAATLGVAAVFGPWIPILRRTLQAQPVLWIQPMSFHELLQVPVGFFARREVVSQRVWQTMSWGVWAALASCLLFLSWRSSKARQARGLELSVSSVAGTFLVAIIFSARRPLIVDRYFTGILPVTCLLVALGVSHLKPRHLALPLCALLLTISAFSAYRTVKVRWQENWRAVKTRIEEDSVPGDAILLFFPVAPEFWRMPFDYYYDGNLPVFCIEGELSSARDLDETLGNLELYDRVWVVQSARFTRAGPLGDEVEDLFSTHRIVFRERFEDQILLQSRMVDVLCVKRLGEPDGS